MSFYFVFFFSYFSFSNCRLRFPLDDFIAVTKENRVSVLVFLWLATSIISEIISNFAVKYAT